MAYQSGLGSTDVMVGVSGSFSGISAGGVFQAAGGRNANAAVRLQRGDQLVFWGTYDFGWEKTRLTPGVTVINQIRESSVGLQAGTITVAGSDQLQVNLGLGVRHELSSSFGLEFFGALPLRPREVNIDGLKRVITLSAGLFAYL